MEFENYFEINIIRKGHPDVNIRGLLNEPLDNETIERIKEV